MACLRHWAWQEHTHFIGFIRETRGGTSRIWDVVCVCVFVCLGVCVTIHVRISKVLLLCVHSAVSVGGVRRWIWFQWLCGSISPKYFYMFAFWLKWPLKSCKIESAFISQPPRMVPFQRRWEWARCVLDAFISEVIFTEQTGRLIINLHLRGQHLNSPSPALLPTPNAPSAVPLLPATSGPHLGLLAQNIFSSDWACPYCLPRSGSSQGRSA